MHVRMLPIIVIHNRDDVFVRRWVKVPIVSNAIRMHGAGNTRKDAKYAIVITMVLLDNLVICTVANVCVAKVSPVDDAINVHPAISVIQHAKDAIVIAMVRLR